MNDNEDGPWSADTALAYMAEKVVEQVALASALATVGRARAAENESSPSTKRQKRVPAAAQAPLGGARGGARKCKTCAGNTDHPSGMCRRCHLAKKDRRVDGK